MPKERRSKNVMLTLLGVSLFLLTLRIDPDPDHPAVGRTLAVAVLMAFFWLSDAIPMAATALIPIVAFPLLGVLTAGDVAPIYVNNIIFLFIGGFLLALAMQRWDLHKRVALRIILTLGRSPGQLLFGFMLGSWLLSQWVSNTATALMMTPIIMALSERLEAGKTKAAATLTICLLLGVAYASSIGGMATLVGTAPNLSLARIFTVAFPDGPEITFLQWMMFALPLSAVIFAVTFAYLRIRVLGRQEFVIDRSIIRQEYASLGQMSYEEKAVSVAFGLFVFFIMTRADLAIGEMVVHGWASRLGVDSFVSDGTVSIAVALGLYLFPSRSRSGSLLDGESINRLPWDIVILLGGGFALAQAFQVSGLSEFLGGKLSVLQNVHPLILLLTVCTMMTFLTELTSNTATTQVMLPIIAAMCGVLQLNPLFLMIPVTITASCAFMLPVATPPNAIVFGTHRLRIADMARVGIVLNLVCIVVVALMMFTLGRVVYGIDLSTPPEWLG